VTQADLFGRVSTADDGARDALDFYETPRWATASLLRHVPALVGATVLEPCAGRNAIAAVLREADCVVETNDLDPRHPTTWHWDARDPAPWETLRQLGVRFDWVVTNPPFTAAFDVLRHAWAAADVGVALLLRKTFLEPTEGRGAWLAAHPPARLVGLPRHPFRGDGTDMVSCDWCVWQRAPVVGPAIVIDAAAKQRRGWRLP
jgi:hypothetical protein